MKKILLISLSVLALAVTSCKKSSQAPHDTSFNTNKSNVYLNDSLVCTASSTSSTAYDWDFGDGSAHSTGAHVKHYYTKSGMFTVTLKVGTASTSHKVKVYPGQFSYQLKNSLDRDITNYQVRVADLSNTSEYFMSGGVLAKGSITDTVFVSLIDDRAVNKVLVDGVIYSAKSNALQVGTGAQFTAGQHTFFEILPSTMCNVYGTSGSVLLPGSAVSFSTAIASY